MTTSGSAIIVNQYYDYGTEYNLNVKSKDDTHYKLTVKVNGIDIVETLEAGEKTSLTDFENVSGLNVVRNLTEDTTISIGLVAETYNFKVRQNLHTDKSDIEPEGKVDDLTEEWQGGFSDTIGTNVYYKLEGSKKYGTEVIIHIYVQQATPRDGNQYYALEEVVIVDGIELTLTQQTEEVEGMPVGSYYTVTYTIAGEPDTDIYVDLDLVAVCYVSITIG